MLPGDDIYDSVDRGIRLWDKVLLCCSGASLTSWWVEKEISAALEKERLAADFTNWGGEPQRCGDLLQAQAILKI